MNCPHCETEIDEHEANGCLDAWVADKVLGKPFRKPTHGICCTCQHCGDDYDSCGGGCYYSTDIAAAWEVVGRRGIWTIKYVNIDSTNLKPGNWQTFVKFLTENAVTTAYAETAPLAICRAALKAVYVGEDGK